MTSVVADQDPGVENWLEAAGHREGHIAIRWQLTDGNLPIPEATMAKVSDVAGLTNFRVSRQTTARGDVRFSPGPSTLASGSRCSSSAPSS